MLAGVGLGAGLVAGPRAADAGEPDIPQAVSTFGVVPGDGAIYQTATPQEAADTPAQSGTPLFLPAGVYSTSNLQLKSGTQIQGMPGGSVLRYRTGGTLLGVDHAKEVRAATAFPSSPTPW